MPETPGDAQLYVNGGYRDGSAGRHEVTSPVTGQVIGSVPVPGQDDVDAAVGAARAAGQNWARVNVWERAAISHSIGDGITARRDELARLQTLEQGKPLLESFADVDEAATPRLARLAGRPSYPVRAAPLLSPPRTSPAGAYQTGDIPVLLRHLGAALPSHR
jgi:Aldehyde dehydrogenase family